jgi:hypothetical protein
MPRIDLPDAEISDIAAWLHSLPVTSRTDPNAENINIVVGEVSAGQAYFEKTCASCHSVTGDLKGIGSRFNAKALQSWWLMPGSSVNRGGGGAAAQAAQGGPVGAATGPFKSKATVTLPSGEKVEGTLSKIDDFNVWLIMPDGSSRSFDRNGDVPKVEVRNPLQPHLDLMLKYTDKNIHDITAYLVTIK